MTGAHAPGLMLQRRPSIESCFSIESGMSLASIESSLMHHHTGQCASFTTTQDSVLADAVLFPHQMQRIATLMLPLLLTRSALECGAHGSAWVVIH